MAGVYTSEDNTIELLSKKNDPNYRSEHVEIPPNQLSGDEHDEGSLLMSMAPSKKANFLLTVTIIMKTTIGGGIISLPYAVSRLGIVMAIILFMVFGFFNYLSSVLLLKAKNLSGHSNFSTIMHYLWNNNFSKLLGSLVIFVDDIGICIMELIILKLTIPKIIVDISGDQSFKDAWYLSELVLVILLALIELPLTLFKKIEKLKIFSFLGVAGIIVFIICVVIHYIIRRSQGFEGQTMEMYPQNWFEAFAVMPNIILAYAFQMNFFPIYKGMKNSSDRKMNWASLAGTLGCGLSYVLVGTLGYSLAGRDAEPNFLQSIEYKQTNTFVFIILNVGYLLSILFSFAILFFGCRNNFIAMINLVTTRKQYTPKYYDKTGDDVDLVEVEADPGQDRAALKAWKNKLFYIYTLIIYFIIILLAFLLDDIEAILNIVGALCENLLATILPAMFYMLCVSRNNKPKTFLYYFSVGMLVVITPFSIWTVICHYL